MLPLDHRLRRSDEFGRTVRRGRRAATRTLVVHLLEEPAETAGGAAPRVGFVVSKAVGGSVVRHAVVRRLRAQARERLHRMPPDTLVVVRALPPAARASSTDLARDLDGALDRLLVKEAA
ncbi:MAG TPA: ribonuclease P protein component [Actinomycetes bacterium]|nr:ribonuclease P protein component [Actinomycetes bacterium]